MRNDKRIAILLVGVVALCGPCAGQKKPSAPSPQSSVATENWQKEFEDVCSKTQDAMVFSEDQLKSLIARCDAIEPQIKKLDETRMKVYLKRLRQCRGLFAYVLESKQKPSK